MDLGNLAQYGVQVGAIYAGVQVVAQGVMAIQKVFTSAPEKTILFKVCKWIVAGPSRWINPAA